MAAVSEASSQCKLYMNRGKEFGKVQVQVALTISGAKASRSACRQPSEM